MAGLAMRGGERQKQATCEECPSAPLLSVALLKNAAEMLVSLVLTSVVLE